MDSKSTKATITTSIAVTAASSRLLKMRRAVAEFGGAAARALACARNPIFGLGSRILCHEAVKVTATSQASGARVMAAYFARCILIMIVVATERATVASN